MRIEARKEALVERRADLRVNRVGAFGHRLRLRLTVIACDGVQLAVRIGDADGIAIDHREVADTRAGERLDGPGAHAAEADDEEG